MHDVTVEESEVRFGYKGDDEGQAKLLEEMVRDGLRLKAFEERSHSFEDILVEVAEQNRKR